MVMRVVSELINKDVFSWAMRRANKSAEELSGSFPMLTHWITSEKQPTIKQLQDFSHSLSFPFGYFFLKSIPQDESVIPLFRASNNEVKCLEVTDIINTVKDRQEWLSEYLKNEDADKVAIAGLCKDDTDTNVIISKMQSALHIASGFTLDRKDVSEALSFVKSALENAGVIVESSGVAGKGTNRPIPVSQCRGFCLVDDYAPFIFVNARDAETAKLFTLLHEAVHIFLAFDAGYGYEDAVYDDIRHPKERLCDKAAANILVPQEALRQFWTSGTQDANVLATKFRVSQTVILRRLLDERLIDKEEFYRRWKTYKGAPRVVKKTRGGGDYYASQAARIGKKLLNCLDTAIKQDKVSPLDAYSLAGMKGDKFHTLIDKIKNKEHK